MLTLLANPRVEACLFLCPTRRRGDVLMKRILMVLTVAALMVATVAPNVSAAPTNTNFGGNENSTLHRNDNSGKGNFGQCQALFGGQLEASNINPSPQNSGAADCRVADNLGAISIADCQPGEEPTAESQLTFGAEPKANSDSSCT